MTVTPACETGGRWLESKETRPGRAAGIRRLYYKRRYSGFRQKTQSPSRDLDRGPSRDLDRGL